MKRLVVNKTPQNKYFLQETVQLAKNCLTKFLLKQKNWEKKTKFPD